MPTAEFDSAPDSVLHIYHPWERRSLSFSACNALWQQHGPQHLLQGRGVVWQGVRIDRHEADRERPRRVAPSLKMSRSAGQLRPDTRHGGSPLASVEQGSQLWRRQRDPVRGRR